jgi:WD40 repeat protein
LGYSSKSKQINKKKSKVENYLDIGKEKKITCLLSDLDEQLILIGTQDGTLIGVDWTSKEIINTFKNRKHHSKQINSIAQNKVNDIIFTGGNDCLVKGWSIKDGSQVARNQFQEPIFKILITQEEIFYFLHHNSVSVMRHDCKVSPN